MPQKTQRVALVRHTADPEALTALGARLCYAGGDVDRLLTLIEQKDQQAFVEKIMSMGHESVLEHVSFTIEAGENVGLVGKTGSGKTTLVDLILRTYNVPDGTIFIDGHDVNSVAIRDVRAGCAYVPQDNFLFSDTIENNIAFGVEERRLQKPVGAARRLSSPPRWCRSGRHRLRSSPGRSPGRGCRLPP